MMIYKLTRPYVLFLFTGLILYLVYTINTDRTLDINVHDTYFVISFGHIGFVALIIYVIYSVIYFLMHQYQNWALSLIHLLFTGIPLGVILFLQGPSLFSNAPRRYYTNTEVSFFDRDLMADSITIIMALFFIGQLVFFINIIIAAAKAVGKKME